MKTSRSVAQAAGRWRCRPCVRSRTRLLRDRGINLSDTQIYRLVTGTPERISLGVLVALCDIFDCSPADLIELKVELRAAKTANAPRLPLDGDTTAPVAHRNRLVEGDDGPSAQA
jgi:DNA-binding Xre family transcriptional regulator